MKFAPGQSAELPCYAMPPLSLSLPCVVLGPCTCQFDPHRPEDPRYTVTDPWGNMIHHLREDAIRGAGDPGYKGTTLADIEAARTAWKENHAQQR